MCADPAKHDEYEAKHPLICVLGPTASGKTSLSVHLCGIFGGEAILSDSIQLYKHCDVLSAKVTNEEASGVPHHLVDSVSPLDSEYSVVQYQRAATAAVESIHEAGKLPIVVGGTVYYALSVFSPNAVLDHAESDQTAYRQAMAKWDTKTDEELNAALDALTSTLSDPPPPITSRRAIRNALVTHTVTGRLPDELYRQQTATPARYPTLVIYLTCAPVELERRARVRVDAMWGEGMLREAVEIYVNGAAAGVPMDRGVFQAIGLKELRPVVDVILAKHGSGQEACDALLGDGRGYRKLPESFPIDESGLTALAAECRDDVVQATVQYARRQAKAVRQLERRGLPVVTIDTTSVVDAGWTGPRKVAEDAVRAFLTSPKSTMIPAPDRAARQTFRCEVCARDVIGRGQFEAHLASGRHKKAVKGQARRARREAPVG